MAPQITLLFLEFLYGFLCAPIVLISGIENEEYMVFLTDKNILFIVLNVYPKLYLEHFNVYFRLVPWTGHALAALQMLVSSRFGPCPTPRISYFLFRSKTVTRGITVLSFYRN